MENEILLCLKERVTCLFSFGTNTTIIMNGNEIFTDMICSKEDASCRHAGEGCSRRRLCHKSGRSKFEMRGFGLE